MSANRKSRRGRRNRRQLPACAPAAPVTAIQLLDRLQQLGHRAAILQAASELVVQLFGSLTDKPPRLAIGHKAGGSSELARLDVVMLVSVELEQKAKAAKDEAVRLLETELSQVELAAPNDGDTEDYVKPPDAPVPNEAKLIRDLEDEE